MQQLCLKFKVVNLQQKVKGKIQKMVQLERNSHYKNRGEKKTKLTTRHLYSEKGTRRQ